MNVDQLIAERYVNTWWRSRPRSEFPPDPQAHEHRRELLAALVGTSGYGRQPAPRSDSADQPVEVTPEPSTDWTKDELVTEIEFLIDTDSPPALAERLGLPINLIIDRLVRAGRRDLARPFREAKAS